MKPIFAICFLSIICMTLINCDTSTSIPCCCNNERHHNCGKNKDDECNPNCGKDKNLGQRDPNCEQDTKHLGDDIKEWFGQLGQIAASTVNKRCVNLPTSDKINKLKKTIDIISEGRKKSEQKLLSFKSITERRFAELANKIIALETNVNKLIGQQPLCPSPLISTSSLSGRILNGVITCEGTRLGDRCSVTCKKGSYSYPTDSTVCTMQGTWKNELPVCKKVKSCQEILRYNTKAQSGVYTIWSKTGYVQYDVYCEMDTDGGGWALAAVIANDDVRSWRFDDVDRDYGDLSSLWENSLILGNVYANTSTTARDFKSRAYTELPARELLITVKGKNYIQSDRACLGDHSLKELFNMFRFSCSGSSYNCHYGKCLNTGGNGISSLCTHQCNIARFYQGNGPISDPLSNGKLPSTIYLKVGEAEKVQDGNKDRVYISTYPYRINVDYVPGLGSFTALAGAKYSNDIGIYHDVPTSDSDKALYYSIFVR